MLAIDTSREDPVVVVNVENGYVKQQSPQGHLIEIRKHDDHAWK